MTRIGVRVVAVVDGRRRRTATQIAARDDGAVISDVVGWHMVSNNVHGVASRLRGRKTPILEQPCFEKTARTARRAGGGVSAEGDEASDDPSPGPLMVGAASTVGAASARQRPHDSVATDELLRRYRLRPGVLRTKLALRNELIERHRALVESMAQTLAQRLPPSVDTQDLVHAGIWGLMQAIDSYRPERCDQFTAFLRIRVRGAMLDELRHMDFLPRLYRRRLREREAALQRLRMLLEREPTTSELAADLGISEAALVRRFEPCLVRAARGLDRGEELDEVELLADEAGESPIEVINRQELLDMVRANLEPMEWKVLQLHYLEGMTGKQVARRLRLSAARICQIHGRVLDRLKAQFAAAADPA